MPNEFQQYKVEVSATTSIEWDVFAICALGLEVNDVLNIINETYFDKGNSLFLDITTQFCNREKFSFCISLSLNTNLQ